MKEWDNKSDQISPFEFEEISEQDIYALIVKIIISLMESLIFLDTITSGYELYFDFETLVPISINVQNVVPIIIVGIHQDYLRDGDDGDN